MKIKYTYFLIFLTISICFYSCQSKEVPKLNSNMEYFSQFDEEQRITFQDELEFKEGLPYRLHLIDSTLVIFNALGRKSSFFFNYTLNNKVLHKGYLKGGRGPGEALGCISNGVLNNKLLWVYDITLKKILITDLNESLNNSTNSMIYHEFPVKNNLYMIELKDTLNYFGVGNRSSKYKIQKNKLESSIKLQEFGEYENINESFPLSLFKSAYESFIFSQPKGNKIALTYRFTDVLEIYDVDTQFGNGIKGPEGFDPEYNRIMSENGYVMERNKKTKFAFVGGSSTEKYLYLLYSGKLEVDENPNYANNIFVYDWNGKPIRKLTLDRDILCFTVSQDDKEIYAYDPNTGNIVKSLID